MLELQDLSGNPARAPQGGVQVTYHVQTILSAQSHQSQQSDQTYTTANFTTTLLAQTQTRTETATITTIAQGYTPSQLTITTTPVATNPTQLKIFVGPAKVPADQNSYQQIAIELQNATGFVAVNQTNISVTLASSDQTVCKIDSITIPQPQTYASATLNTTYKSGSATITAVATDLSVGSSINQHFRIYSFQLGIYCVPVTLPADNKTYQAIQVQLQDVQGRPAKDPKPTST